MFQNGRSRLSSQSDPYDTANVPSPIPAVSYQYDPTGKVLTTTNQLGQQATNQYDAVGNLVATTNFLGQQTLFGYDWLNRPVTTTQVLAGQPNLVSYVAYDEAGNLRSRTDPRGVTTTYDYDELNRLITTTVPLISGGVMRTVNTYDASGNISTTTRLNSGTGYSGNQVTRYQYDELNRIVTTTLGYGSLNYHLVNIYDKAGNVAETRQSKGAGPSVTNWTDPSQVVTSATTYDALNRPLTSIINAWSASGGSKLLTTSYSYNDSQNLYTTTDPYGIVTTVQRDGVGRTISTTLTPASPANGAQAQTSYNFYNPVGSLVRTIDPLGNWTDTGYDGLYRAISTTAYTGAGGTGTVLTSRTYYTDTTRPQVTTIGPAPHYARSDTYLDEVGRTITTTAYTGAPVAYPTIPGGALSTTYGYDPQGNRTSVTDPTGHQTLFGYENTGWLRAVTQTVTAGGSLQTLLTSYTYDLLGNRLNTTDAASHSVTVTYDVLNRLTDEYDALTNHWQTGYDGLGRVTSRTDAKTQTTSYSYDNASRLLTVSSPGSLTTSYTYNDGGQPLTMADSNPNQTTSYSYDGLNRLLSVSSPQGVVQYSYDNLSRRTQLAFGPNTSSLKQVGYQYDGLSRPVTLTNWLSQAAVYSYSGARLSQLSYPNGVNAAYSFDGMGRLTNLNQTKGASTIFSATYSLDNLGRRTAISELLNGTSRNLGYQYDELSRLTQESQKTNSAQPVTSTYLYDGVGNRTQMVSQLPPNTKSGVGTLVLTTTYSYNGGDQLTNRADTGSVTPFHSYSYNYSYDANASLTSETNTASGGEVTSYSWDSRNRLTQVQKQAKGSTLSTASFSYDGKDTRLSMSYGGKTTSYLQDVTGLAVVLQETVSGVSTPSNFMYPLGSTSPLFQSDANSTSLWYHKDGLGSVRALTGATGSVINTDSYSAFGLTQGETGKAANNHLFAGEQLDPTGLYFNRARYYSPSLGRFIARDSVMGSVSNPLSLNRFVYTTNNPANFIDPDGNMQIASDGGDGLAGGNEGNIDPIAQNPNDLGEQLPDLNQQEHKHRDEDMHVICSGAFGAGDGSPASHICPVPMPNPAPYTPPFKLKSPPRCIICDINCNGGMSGIPFSAGRISNSSGVKLPNLIWGVNGTLVNTSSPAPSWFSDTKLGDSGIRCNKDNNDDNENNDPSSTSPIPGGPPIPPGGKRPIKWASKTPGQPAEVSLDEHYSRHRIEFLSENVKSKEDYEDLANEIIDNQAHYWVGERTRDGAIVIYDRKRNIIVFTDGNWPDELPTSMYKPNDGIKHFYDNVGSNITNRGP